MWAALANGGKILSESDPEVSEAVDFVEFYRASARAFFELPGVRAEPRGVVVVVPPSAVTTSMITPLPPFPPFADVDAPFASAPLHPAPPPPPLPVPGRPGEPSVEYAGEEVSRCPAPLPPPRFPPKGAGMLIGSTGSVAQIPPPPPPAYVSAERAHV